jgi:hypothetical protein
MQKQHYFLLLAIFTTCVSYTAEKPKLLVTEWHLSNVKETPCVQCTNIRFKSYNEHLELTTQDNFMHREKQLNGTVELFTLRESSIAMQKALLDNWTVYLTAMNCPHSFALKADNVTLWK